MLVCFDVSCLLDDMLELIPFNGATFVLVIVFKGTYKTVLLFLGEVLAVFEWDIVACCEGDHCFIL